MTRVIMSSVFVLAIVFSVNAALAHQDSGPQWVNGEVMGIEEGQNESVLSVKMADGEIFNVAAANNLIAGVNVGDNVTAEIMRGWAEGVEITESAPAQAPKAEKSQKGAQWVSGEVVSMEKGATDSVIGVKMYNGQVFNVAVANDKLGNVQVGSNVSAKVKRGWAKKVTKK